MSESSLSISINIYSIIRIIPSLSQFNLSNLSALSIYVICIPAYVYYTYQHPPAGSKIFWVKHQPIEKCVCMETILVGVPCQCSHMHLESIRMGMADIWFGYPIHSAIPCADCVTALYHSKFALSQLVIQRFDALAFLFPAELSPQK